MWQGLLSSVVVSCLFIGLVFTSCGPEAPKTIKIGINAPLVFDLYDRWSERSVAGCTYHVAHPGGRHFEKCPVNAYEAESRRLTRYETIGHTPGKPIVTQKNLNPEYPYTLDLRLPH